MDMALVAAENLLQSGDEELRNHTHAKLKELKSLWEETSTYIIHCHRCCSTRCTLTNVTSRGHFFKFCSLCGKLWPHSLGVCLLGLFHTYKKTVHIQYCCLAI